MRKQPTNTRNHLLRKFVFSIFIFLVLISCNKKDEVKSPVTTVPPPPPPPPPPVITYPCQGRPEINVTLTKIGSLSVGRFWMGGASAGNKIVFAGGSIPGAYSSRVDIYDTITKAWSIAELTIPERQGLAVATVGNKIFFAGGTDADWFDVTSRIDIYDASTNTWSTAELSSPRAYLAAITVGNKIFFAGGANWGPLNPGSNTNYFVGSTVVDVYDNASNSWTTTNLSEGRYELSATAVGNKIYFAGGLNSIFSISAKIDIYDITTNSWSTSQLRQNKAGHASIAIGNKIFWASGANTPYWSGSQMSDQVEERDVVTDATTFDCMIPKRFSNAVVKDGKVIFFTGLAGNDIYAATHFEIYDIARNQWSTGVMTKPINGAAIISVNNTVYVAGGGDYSKDVYKLEF